MESKNLVALQFGISVMIALTRRLLLGWSLDVSFKTLWLHFWVIWTVEAWLWVLSHLREGWSLRGRVYRDGRLKSFVKGEKMPFDILDEIFWWYCTTDKMRQTGQGCFSLTLKEVQTNLAFTICWAAIKYQNQLSKSTLAKISKFRKSVDPASAVLQYKLVVIHKCGSASFESLNFAGIGTGKVSSTNAEQDATSFENERE